MTSDDTAITEDELAELERLREENETLRGQAYKKNRGRGLWAIVLVVIGSLLLPFAVTTTWMRTEVVSTSGFVETAGPLADDPAIQEAIATRVSDVLAEELEIEEAVAELLPSQAEALAPLIASGANEVIDTVALEVAQSAVFAQLWREALEVTHRAALAVLAGRDDGAIQVDGGTIFVPIGEIVVEVATRVGEQIGIDLVGLLPEGIEDQRYVIAQSDELESISGLLETLDRLAWLTVLFSLAALIAAVFVAPTRSRGVLWVGVGLATAMFFTRLGLALARNVYEDGLSGSALDVDAGLAFYDIMLRFLMRALRVVFIVGVVMILAGWLTGSGKTAGRIRAWFDQLIGRTSEHRDADKEPGTVLRLIGDHRYGLRTTLIVLAVIVLFSWENPTGLVVLFVALVTGLLVGLVALAARVVDNADAEETVKAVEEAVEEAEIEDEMAGAVATAAAVETELEIDSEADSASDGA
ncbi:MAG: hypothetical protein ACR2O6_12055 [Ilumatobacteraceae bacterium]